MAAAMVHRRSVLAAVLQLAAVSCAANVAAGRIASDSVVGIPAQIQQQQELSWRRQLSSGTRQVRLR